MPAFKLGSLPELRGNPARALFFALWLAPLLAFYTIVHIGDPGYVFSFLPALCILAAKSLDVAARLVSKKERFVYPALVGAIALANTGVFFLYPRLLTFQGITRIRPAHERET